MTQSIDSNVEDPDHIAELTELGKINGDTENDLASREYFNLPAIDIRTTVRWCYFDIELPGVTDQAGIGIQWVSTQCFVVEGEIPRPRISTRDELDDHLTLKDLKKSVGTSIGSPNGLDSLKRRPARKHTNTVIKEGVIPNGEITPKPKDDYPGFPHLLRCPASGPHHAEKDNTADPTPTDSRVVDEQHVPESPKHKPSPMDEIALMHSRSLSFKTSSHRHKPHNDHDFQPHAHPFGFLSNHNEHQTPQYVVRNNSTDAPDAPLSRESARGSSGTSDEILRPIENEFEPQLLLAERQIGTYKRRCTIPGNGAVKVHIERTEAKLEAGVLTVRVPRKLGVEKSDEASELFCGWKVFVD